MPDYRRNLVAGGCFFLTVALLDRRSDLLVTHVDALRGAVRQVRARAPFTVDAWVVLPDHMHCVWTLPAGDADSPGRWRAIKTAFSKALPGAGVPSAAMVARGERGIWQRRYWEHTIRDERDYAAHVDYTHFNPVKHGYVSHPAAWPYSSFRRCVAAGRYPPGWSGGGDEPAEAGERRLETFGDVERWWRGSTRLAECAALFRPTLTGEGIAQVATIISRLGDIKKATQIHLN